MNLEKSKEEQLNEILHRQFPDSEIEVVNMSHLHAGHGGDDGSGESHFEIFLRAAELNKLSRIERQRYLHQVIGPELFSSIHSISFHIGTGTK